MREVVVVGGITAQTRAEFQHLVITLMLHNYETNRSFTALKKGICDTGVEIHYAQLDAKHRQKEQ